MKAVQLNEYGPSENLTIVDVPIPDPAQDEVLIRVEASGVRFSDILMRSGVYRNLPHSLPFVPGREVAGIVEKVGGTVSHFRPGARVMAEMHTGGYAEYASAAEKEVIRLPDRVSFLEGLVYHRNLRIAYLCYYIFGRIQPNATILLHAAAGGIGTLITRIAKKRGNNVVIALYSSDEKFDHCRANGADYGINYIKKDYIEEVLQITGGKGVDVSCNSVGGPTLITDPRVIRPLGRWVIYGQAAGHGHIDPYGVVMSKSLTVKIFSVYAVREREEFRQATDFLENWLQTEELFSVSKTFEREDAIAAHQWIEGRHSIGKIALV